MLWVQSGHRVVNFSTWGFSLYQSSSQDVAQNITYVLEKERTAFTRLNDYIIII